MREIYPNTFREIRGSKVWPSFFPISGIGLEPEKRRIKNIQLIRIDCLDKKIYTQKKINNDRVLFIENKKYCTNGYKRIPYHFSIDWAGRIKQLNPINLYYRRSEFAHKSLEILFLFDIGCQHIPSAAKNAVSEIFSFFEKERLNYMLSEYIKKSPNLETIDLFFKNIYKYPKKYPRKKNKSIYFETLWDAHMNSKKEISDLSLLDLKSFLKHLYIER